MNDDKIIKHAVIDNEIQGMLLKLMQRIAESASRPPYLELRFEKLPDHILEDLKAKVPEEIRHIAEVGEYAVQGGGGGNDMTHAVMIKIFMDQMPKIKRLVGALLRLDRIPDDPEASKIVLAELEDMSERVD